MPTAPPAQKNYGHGLPVFAALVERGREVQYKQLYAQQRSCPSALAGTVGVFAASDAAAFIPRKFNCGRCSIKGQGIHARKKYGAGHNSLHEPPCHA